MLASMSAWTGFGEVSLFSREYSKLKEFALVFTTVFVYIKEGLLKPGYQRHPLLKTLILFFCHKQKEHCILHFKLRFIKNSLQSLTMKGMNFKYILMKELYHPILMLRQSTIHCIQHIQKLSEAVDEWWNKVWRWYQINQNRKI